MLELGRLQRPKEKCLPPTTLTYPGPRAAWAKGGRIGQGGDPKRGRTSACEHCARDAAKMQPRGSRGLRLIRDNSDTIEHGVAAAEMGFGRVPGMGAPKEAQRPSRRCQRAAEQGGGGESGVPSSISVRRPLSRRGAAPPPLQVQEGSA
jgi:hypothetical protein